ncbi:MAG: hypothetical protein NVS9B15_00300 [Acidobacteriaceae bacterium]
MLENWKPRSFVAGLLVATTTLAMAQTQTNTAPQQTSDANSPLPNAPISQPVKRFDLTDYSKGKRQFPNVIAPYKATDVQPPSFDNAPRLESLIRNGNLYLSLTDAIALALENNLDLAIARYNLPIADTDILRARGGGSTSGVNTGLVSGTQGGNGSGVTTGANAASQGAGAGGTSAGTGGAGTGSSGLVQSSLGAGPNVPQLDPTLSGTVQYDNNKSLSSNPFSGAPTLQQNTTTADFAYNQGFLTGTNLSVGFNNNRLTTNSSFASLNPQLNSNFRATVTQHLLNGFGISNNNRFIRIALNDRQIANLAFRQQVFTTVSQIEDIYWDLVNAYENVVAQERGVSLGQKLLSDNQRQVQIGTLAPIAVVQAQSQLATSQQNLIVAQTNLQLQQYLMLNAVARNVSSNLQLTKVKVVPTDRMDVSAYTEQNLDTDQLIKTAYDARPDIQESLIDLKNREITRKSAKNALLPTLDAFAYYGGSALAGNQNPASTCAPGQTTFCTPAGSIAPSGFGTAFSNLFNNTAPDKGAGVQLLIPIRNRVNQSTQIRSELEEEQAKLRLLQLRNQVTVDVRNAVYAVQQDRAQVDAARAAQTYATQNLEAEQKKYSLGASTSYNVQQLQNALTQSEQTQLTAITVYEKARVQLDLVTGQTLARYGIEMGEATTGEVIKQPTVPGITPLTPDQQRALEQQLNQPLPQINVPANQQLQPQTQPQIAPQ